MSLRSWGTARGVDTLKNRENPMVLMGAYTCHWRDYSTLRAHVVAFATCCHRRPPRELLLHARKPTPQRTLPRVDIASRRSGADKVLA
jgi:hypothetical protein